MASPLLSADAQSIESKLETSKDLQDVIAAHQGGRISANEAIILSTPELVSAASSDRIDPSHYTKNDVFSLIGTPGVGTGKTALSRQQAESYISDHQDFILVVNETGPEDMHVLLHKHAKGFVTSKGGITSHAAMVALQQGKPSVIGIGEGKKDFFENGEVITIDGQSGVIKKGTPPIIKATPEKLQALVDIAKTITKSHVGGGNKIIIKGIVDTADEAAASIALGAEGIGLCRTEHNFFQEDRLPWFQQLILATNDAQKQEALSKLKEFEKSDFKALLKSVKGKMLRVRLLDAPLNEFLPSDHADAEDVEALAHRMGMSVTQVENKIEALKENNPMLGGNRAVRLGIVQPEIYKTQAQAFLEAAAETIQEGVPVTPGLFIPLVAVAAEAKFVTDMIREEQKKVEGAYGVEIPLSVGVMAEIPSACLSMDKMAPHIDFISCGMNDLTQMTYGFSRDDMSEVIAHYLKHGLLQEDPFKVVTPEVAELIAAAASRGKSVNPSLEISVCGVQTIPTSSMDRTYDAGVESVSVEVPFVQKAIIQSARRFLMHQKEPLGKTQLQQQL